MYNKVYLYLEYVVVVVGRRLVGVWGLGSIIFLSKQISFYLLFFIVQPRVQHSTSIVPWLPHTVLFIIICY